MESKDHEEEHGYEPRPHDYLVEPMFAQLEKQDGQEGAPDQLEPPRPGPLGRFLTWIFGR